MGSSDEWTNCYCEVRFSEDDTRQSPGILSGVLMPYGVKAQDRAEMFELGALTWPDDGILVRRMHDRSSPLVKVVPYLDGTDLRIDSPLLNSTAGRDQQQKKCEAGVLTGLSVEFSATKETRARRPTGDPGGDSWGCWIG